MSVREKAANGCLSDIDRLSDLPDYLLHHIISFLGTKEACRTTILSKRWVNIWSTGFILDFNPRLFGNVPRASRETFDGLVPFVEATMQRYSDQNLSIRKLVFEYPNVDTEMAGRIDRWLRIAVENQVEDLSLDIIEAFRTPEDLPTYWLPMILFSAKSLISFKCCRVRVPHFPPVMLISLQSLNLYEVVIDEHILQHIIRSCPLKKLWLGNCLGINNLSIPNCSKLELLDVVLIIPSGGSIEVGTSSIKHFSYWGFSEFDSWWPFNFSPASMKNLSVLKISFIHIMDKVVEKLVSELLSIKILSISDCTMPRNIRISSLTLEDLVLGDCYRLVNIAFDAPQLKTFCYNGRDVELSSVTSRHYTFNAHLNLTLDDLDTELLVAINRLLSGSKCWKVLSINISDVSEIEIDMDQLRTVCNAPPCEVEELKLVLSCSISEESSLTTLLDGLFWSCRPTMLSLSIPLRFDKRNGIVGFLLVILEEKVNSWKHPLKRIEIEGTDHSSIFSSLDIELRLRLFW